MSFSEQIRSTLRYLIVRVLALGAFARLTAFSSGRERANLIVSLTTYPDKVAKSYLAILSILAQRTPPWLVVVNLSQKQFSNGDSDLPLTLRFLAWAAKGQLRWNFVPGDDKSYKKIVPSLELLSNGHAVVTIDDDVWYPSRLIEHLVSVSTANPDSVIGTRGVRIARFGDTFAPYVEWPRILEEVGGRDVLLTGSGAILYPPNSLPEATGDRELFLRLAPTADDLWLKVQAHSVGFSHYVAPMSESEFLAVAFRRRGLFEFNVGRSGNDIAWNELMLHYGLDVDSFVP